VAKLKERQRNYSVLDFLETKPRTTYLAKVRNPNPAMPDYTSPRTFEEFEEKNGNPFGGHGHEAAAPGHAEPAHAGEKGAH
jgi:molybdopterin-containing oxidoreductase family iron-sulfur binding subunit